MWFDPSKLARCRPANVAEVAGVATSGDSRRRYLGQWRVPHPISRHYPAVIARPGSCASPIPSRQLGIPLA